MTPEEMLSLKLKISPGVVKCDQLDSKDVIKLPFKWTNTELIKCASFSNRCSIILLDKNTFFSEFSILIYTASKVKHHSNIFFSHSFHV